MSQRTENVAAAVATLVALDVLIVWTAWHIAVDMVRYSVALAISAAPTVLLWLVIDYGNDLRKYG